MGTLTSYFTKVKAKINASLAVRGTKYDVIMIFDVKVECLRTNSSFFCLSQQLVQRFTVDNLFNVFEDHENAIN